MLTPSALLPVLNDLAALLKAYDLAGIDRWLVGVNVANATPETLVALLRMTYPVRREGLPHWVVLLEKVRVELDERGLDGRLILRGLVD